MTSRREFLKAGLVASALPMAARAELGGAPAARGATVPLYKVLCDTRFAASVAFARRAEALGVPVHGMAGDMTRFWYDDLYYLWRQQPAAIAGITAHGALFCLERLAWEQRLRVVYRGEHVSSADGRVAHRFAGPAPLLRAAAGAATEPEWAAALAEVLTQCPGGRTVPGARQAVTARAAGVPAPEALYSWVIAPVSRE
jgi:hypothetical protein